MVGRFAELHDVIKLMAPEGDWAWLRNTINRLRQQARPKSDKAAKVHSSVWLVEAGFTTFERRLLPSGESIIKAEKAG